MSESAARVETLNEMLLGLASEAHESTAVIYAGRELSYGDLAARVNRLAAGLASYGIGAGDRVAVWLPNLPAWVELEFALGRLGAIAVAVNTKFRRREVEDILERSQAKMLVLSAATDQVDYLSLVNQFDGDRLDALEALVVVEGDVPGPVAGRLVMGYESLLEHGEFVRDNGRPDSPCNVFTSSGTTSAPKLILHRQSAITHQARAIAGRFGFAEARETIVLAMLPFCGVFGFNTVMGALAARRPVVLQYAFDAESAIDLTKQHRVTHTSGADEMFRRILISASNEQISTLRAGAFANFSTDASALVADGRRRDIKLFQTFGSSEVQALMSYPPVGSGPERWALGGGYANLRCHSGPACDVESGELLPDGESGELEVSWPNVMVGYMGDSEATARAVTADGYVRTGDLGYLEGADNFVYLARLGDTLRLGGFLVNPREIEAYLEDFVTIERAQVVAVDTAHGPRPVAFAIPAAGALVDEATVIKSCQAEMAKFKVPIRLLTIEAFPTTSSANGEKIQKTKLREQAQAAIDAALVSSKTR